MGLFSKDVSAITREKALEIARKNVKTNRDDMELITIVNATTSAFTAIEKFVAPAGFKFFWAKRDAWAEGRYFISITQSPYGWKWLEDNHVIMVFPDGSRLTFDHREGWLGKVLQAGTVYEYKEMNVSSALDTLASVFGQDEPVKLRVGRFDYVIDSRYFAYFQALKEEVDRRG